MSHIENTDTVTLIYTGKLDNGDIFKSVTKDKPLTISMGESEAPPTLQQALLGMSVNESKSVRVPPEEGYGVRHKNLLQQIKKESFGAKVSPKPGMILSLNIEKNGEQQQIPATVIEINNDMVTVDYNHPLAGHHLNYELTVIEIKK